MKYKGINRMTREKILGSEEFKRMSSFTYADVVRDVCGLGSIGGLVRGTPHRFLCFIQKMGEISLREEAVAGVLEELKPAEIGSEEAEVSMGRFKGSVYLIAAFLLYLRLSEKFHKYRPLFASFLMDFRKIPMVDEQNGEVFIYLDVFVDYLLNKSRVLDVHLSKSD